MKEMIKKYKGTLICSVLVMLAGILVGFTMAQSIWINVFFVVTDCIQTAEQQGYRDGHMDDTCYRVNL